MTIDSINGRIDTSSRVILASPHLIYQAFINPEAMATWLPPKGMSARIDLFEPYPGGKYVITLSYDSSQSGMGKTSDNTDVSKGVFVELVPNKKIVQVGKFESDDPTFSGKIILTWYIEALSEATKVTVVCENVPEGIKKADHIEGLASTLENLAAYTEE
ncbi:SRPBCC domain-containing protein [Alkalibacterium sp. MB6]|uniref:SRPBCC domain-containing protein n=1 Tax=Alkalibacterium sp. MB6 TaxID=2081965 RepID=UPI001379D90A|nr:SRPBCC domain-containing protein [Alkalibacterium sp. MB6]